MENDLQYIQITKQLKIIAKKSNEKWTIYSWMMLESISLLRVRLGRSGVRVNRD
jgi:hypothetical protein